MPNVKRAKKMFVKNCATDICTTLITASGAPVKI